MGEVTSRDYTDIQTDPIVETIELDGIGRFNFSAKELKRYTENAKFAEAIYDDLYHFLDPDKEISEEFLTQRSNDILQSLSKKQRNVFQKVINKVIELHRKTATADKPQIIDRFRRVRGSVGWSTDTILDSDFFITPFGSIVVKVRDKETWRQFAGSESTEGTMGNNTIHSAIVFGFTAKKELNDDERLIAADEAIRTTMVDANSPRVQKNIQHELFHDLYRQAIEQATECTYDVLPKENMVDDRSKATEFFLMIKNELIAYAIAGRWQLDFRRLIDGRTREKLSIALTENKILDDESIRVYIQEKIEESIGKDKHDPEIEVVYKKIKDDIMVNMALTQREIVRLELQESESFDQAIQVLLTAQDFKEVFYRLSKIDSGKEIDAMSIVKPSDNATTVNHIKIDNTMYRALYHKIPVKRLTELMELVTRYIEELKTAGSDDPDIQERLADFTSTLDYFEHNKEGLVVG
ncbi:MAG: hypothetical protein A2821_01880 [Candidatus Magasanikbacteria bacterium RIFCSPHIGHO2_01_FULL_41_23]|uniref:Uncharacterized protein n=1 Tax=Candidatus Magasanikbacteria bacterium RIFCSPLOWO2_01_FULL_40_15 TaxID=1798686 RepID=A0A1F6N3W8_9BACT|nr:MAG: hypothetical protein A2821_01880 [Candidatus Magasanikbacteria bacterium RIFCSPHIGHO2_01_FULL_41_23]OGH67096.1 MAG: hypothetical protein A3C66_00185 [Candidatus Magasanikbacteria bacterium RIFCSPHIGHO2_02_FULL_41_35]OGH76416.1 MAG: hypothetical protein A3F22_02355 [Candidatus Magasanikbacteria bacterium RIFCSPHIGHO2_12_FULL_41_16]OGH78363.1 MAG: hypothetical protein A2983_00130 [Candidatus Magasanikbacteria bacterium RIFCSPLOWO2_01_FULL_40_15]